MHYFNYREMKARGWSSSTIRQILHQADKKVQVSGRRPIDLFEVDKVKRAEELHPYFSLPYRDCRKAKRKAEKQLREAQKANRVDVES